jgi:hypothetical protein
MRKIIGLFLYLWLICIKGTYKGRNIFYKISQDGNPFALALLKSDFGYVFIQYEFLRKNAGKDRLPSPVSERYCNETIGGYADSEDSEQRDLVIPLVEKAIRDNSCKRIVELGTARGDVIGKLSEKYAGCEYSGIDFFVNKAKRYPNVKYLQGYALDMLEKGLPGDAVFGCSVFMFFTPMELKSYLKQFAKNGFKQIIISEPIWGGYVQENNSKAFSRHMEDECWFHNYCGYLRESGYKIADFSFSPYRPEGCNRPDVFQILVRGIAG